MKQLTMWAAERSRAASARWTRLPEKARAEVVAQFVRLVVESSIAGRRRAHARREEPS
jgi:hypothetical protein